MRNTNKRLLKKKSWNKIKLYHGTNFSSIEKIISSGSLEPGGYHNTTNTGRSRTTYDIADNSTKTDELSLRELLEIIENYYAYDDLIKTTESLEKKVQKLFNSGESLDTLIPVEELRFSENQNGVYLTDKPFIADGYASQASDEQNRDFAVVLQIEVDEDALGPDYDDLPGDYEFNTRDKLYKQSLDEISQCVHYGPIFLEDIFSFKLIVRNKDLINEEFHYMLNTFISKEEFINLVNLINE